MIHSTLIRITLQMQNNLLNNKIWVNITVEKVINASELFV